LNVEENDNNKNNINDIYFENDKIYCKLSKNNNYNDKKLLIELKNKYYGDLTNLENYFLTDYNLFIKNSQKYSFKNIHHIRIKQQDNKKSKIYDNKRFTKKLFMIKVFKKFKIYNTKYDLVKTIHSLKNEWIKKRTTSPPFRKNFTLLLDEYDIIFKFKDKKKKNETLTNNSKKKKRFYTNEKCINVDVKKNDKFKEKHEKTRISIANYNSNANNNSIVLLQNFNNNKTFIHNDLPIIKTDINNENKFDIDSKLQTTFKNELDDKFQSTNEMKGYLYFENDDTSVSMSVKENIVKAELLPPEKISDAYTIDDDQITLIPQLQCWRRAQSRKHAITTFTTLNKNSNYNDVSQIALRNIRHHYSSQVKNLSDDEITEMAQALQFNQAERPKHSGELLVDTDAWDLLIKYFERLDDESESTELIRTNMIKVDNDRVNKKNVNRGYITQADKNEINNTNLTNSNTLKNCYKLKIST
jgi:hypothetical protein